VSETELPAWADVATAADRLELASTPAELHGALCGWLAAGGADQASWIATVMVFAWCRAFLGGFGLAVGDKPLSEDGKEALGDLANLAAARIEEVDPEQDEESLTEIEEYLRMAVLLLHADCALGPRSRQRLH
jgi:uncharacterized protein YgfB (UPF0149 family)